MEIHCDFSDDSVAYKCFVYNQDLSSPHEITNFIGEHMGRKTNADVVSVSFIDCTIKSLPRNLVKFFPNINVLELISCTLKELKKDDLIGYKKLMYLGIVDNQLTHLPSDLFEYTPNLQFIDFSSNQITSIGPRIFDSLKELKHANLSHNRTIDIFYEEDSDVTFEELITAIKSNCRPMESLKGISATKLTESINDENVTELFFYSCRFDIVGLKRKSFAYMKQKLMPWLDEKMEDQPEKLIGMIGRNNFEGCL